MAESIPDIVVEKRSHHFKVSNISRFAKGLIDEYSKSLIHWGYIREGRRFRRAPLKVFAASNFNRDEYRFHIHDFAHFLIFLNERGLKPAQIKIIDKPIPVPKHFDLPIKKGWVPRENQEPAISYITDPEGPRQRLIVLQTGFGKSLISMMGASRLHNRFVLVARPMFLDKWVLDIKKTYDIPKEEILVIRGAASLMGLLTKARDKTLTERVILISNKTLQVYINNYERFGDKGLEDMGYDASPDDLFELLGGGIRIIDEVHLDFHFNFKLDLYTHTERSLSLTATLLTDDAFIRRMHEMAYKPSERYVGSDTKPYINSVALLYQFEHYDSIRYLDVTGKTYSHHVFEKSIMRQKLVMDHYSEMILKMIRIYFINRTDRKDGDRFIVFCSSIEMCTKITAFLKKNLPSLDIRRYVEDDPYENLMEPDGRVSTLLSAGTAVDIKQLTTTILTTAINSSPANVQGFGRLRQLEDKRNPTFIYFSDMNNPKHMDYHERKCEIIKPRSASFKEIQYSSLI